MRTAPLFRIAIPAFVLVLTACSTAPAPTSAPPPAASAPAAATNTTKVVPAARSANIILRPASGSLVSGKLSALPIPGGVRITGEIGGLKRGGTHAIHIHEKGDCSAADATSAGGHFNPAQQSHGRVGSSPHHGGDMDNIVADGSGVAQVDVQARGVSLGGGATNIGGRAIVVHAMPDDYISQPAGNAGARVACGIIQLVH